MLAFLKWARERKGQAQVLASMAEFAALTGNRRIEFLELHWSQISDTEARLIRGKQRDKQVVEVIGISPALSQLLARLRTLAKNDRLGAVFPNRAGNCYTEQGFKAMWSKLVAKALEEKAIEKRFTFHDLRFYHVTQHKIQRGALPDLHANPGTTARIYDPALKLYDQWQKLTLEFLREQYGESLRSVVLHYDEEYVHLHYYAANKPMNGTLNLDGLDFASDAERALGMDRKTRNKSGAERKAVRANALRGFQEAYFRGVAKALGWLRLGPQKTRLTRQQYLREKEIEREMQEAREKADSLLINIDSLTSSLATSRQMYNEAKNEISKELGELAQAVRSLRIQSTPSKLKDAEEQVAKISNRLKLKI